MKKQNKQSWQEYHERKKNRNTKKNNQKESMNWKSTNVRQTKINKKKVREKNLCFQCEKSEHHVRNYHKCREKQQNDQNENTRIRITIIKKNQVKTLQEKKLKQDQVRNKERIIIQCCCNTATNSRTEKTMTEREKQDIWTQSW